MEPTERSKERTRFTELPSDLHRHALACKHQHLGTPYNVNTKNANLSSKGIRDGLFWSQIWVVSSLATSIWVTSTFMFQDEVCIETEEGQL